MDTQYKYDALGRRIQKNVNSQVTTFVYDGLNMVTDYTGLWTVRSKYFFGLGLDEPLSIDQSSNLYYYQQDGLGRVNRLTNASVSMARTHSYDSFGKNTSRTGTLDQPFAFTGRDYDPETGLYYYRARYYDPKAGRFISKDPIGFGGGDVNLFRHVKKEY
jgi:RHS repeat-associated protein